MNEEKKELQNRIEAALYISGRPLSPEELAKAAGITSTRKAIRLTSDLAKTINDKNRAIEIIEYSERRFAMQLREKYSNLAKRFSLRPLLLQSALKTLTYISIYQPISSKNLAQKRGAQVYQQLKHLVKLGFIGWEPTGRTKTYRTTRRFSEYFGLSPEMEMLKKQLAAKGLTKTV